ncbi:hypothetical protein ACFYPB_12160 [Streptomyces olivaceoviridis]|uniref:hypothetical protein n=1 Tax=Streptomyces olivaceoviridis TaxID=1921 RepID=UPI0036A07BF8
MAAPPIPPVPLGTFLDNIRRADKLTPERRAELDQRPPPLAPHTAAATTLTIREPR